ncbi:hypothetical protein GTP23_20170 [Pseudoduganella sp. FT93W]|uniref:Type II secretion system protein n=1 Tax=Duganella fentianensis TaxID=2692177 RepID=A0A845I231_9BURK|nr:hypothetical protein [Duganella fentianensis]MYN47363.1 hypothetical protein [Duganella fentianensis]
MCTPHRPIRRQRGAALLMLLSVLALGAATVIVHQWDSRRSERQRAANTQRLLRQASEALMGYAMTHGRLPRPAISATDGHQNPNPCNSESACTGILPWVTLGVSGLDSWGRTLRYSVTPAFANGPPEVGVSVATKTIQGRDSSGALYFIDGQERCHTGADCVPVLVYSEGKNRSAGGDAADEAQNLATSQHYILRAASAEEDAPGGAFDDMIVWLPLKEYFRRMSAAGRLL